MGLKGGKKGKTSGYYPAKKREDGVGMMKRRKRSVQGRDGYGIIVRIRAGKAYLIYLTLLLLL